MDWIPTPMDISPHSLLHYSTISAFSGRKQLYDGEKRKNEKKKESVFIDPLCLSLLLQWFSDQEKTKKKKKITFFHSAFLEQHFFSLECAFITFTLILFFWGEPSQSNTHEGILHPTCHLDFFVFY